MAAPAGQPRPRIVKDAAGKLRFYAVERLGPTQSVTPEGYLVCHDVPIARTGTQLYLANEVPVDAGSNGQVQIHRRDDEVFRPETLASFEGKSVTIDHPDDWVTPENWKELSVGVVQNVRRGEGLDQDLLIADLLITDAEAIELVRKGLRQVSCGYDADYVQETPGNGYQRNIIGNHVALVDRGRAGPRCAIQDKEPQMSKLHSWKDRIWAAFSSRDAEGLAKAIEEGDKTGDEDPDNKEDKDEGKAKTGDRAVLDAIFAEVKKLSKRVGDVETSLEEMKTDDEDPDEKKDDKGKTDDTVIEAEKAGKADVGTTYTGDAYRELVARAEILSPGFSIPTTDSVKTVDAATKLQRRVLTEVMTSDAGKSVVAPFLAGRQLETLTADSLNSVFVGAAELMRQRNNSTGARSGITTKDFGRTTSPASMNQAAQEFWANRR
ncbi:DUF2213 domain-containing protein [Chromobacterium violaceum]|uniref:DUF2213 domain-containing protein n=1 Tax=Chromobacterium violaceum TaxID=536 RepID=UPI00068B2CF8|nr:DUF2213 domain-containing protein [Chromobacterium violaceum]